MRNFNGSTLRSIALACAFATVGGGAVLPERVLAQPAAAARGLPDFTDLVDQVGPSVVNIRTVEKASSRSGANGMDEEMLEFFRRFGVPIPNMPRQQRPQRPQDDEPQPRGLGSGFILTGDGYVMTNAHVVEGADEVIVTLTDKREFKAKIIGADKRTDVAVVKIDATGLPAVKVGDVGRLRVGEWVMAIGSPFGLENTVTAGIVSAKQRDTGDYLPFIQTDVAINPGNSGGPLFNLKGEVVGINSQIYSRSGGYQGISFAIPIDVAMKVKEQLQKTGKVQRGRLGVTMQPVTKELAESFGLAKPVGALVTGVDRSSPADKAGLQPGDVIIALDGVPIEEATDLPRKVGDSAPGTKLGLTVLRDGKRLEKQAVLAAMPSETAPQARGESAGGGRVGLAVRSLSREEAAALGSSGVVVVGVNGPAARAGLQEGDVVLAVNNTRVSSPAQLKELLDQAGKRFALLIQREDARLYVPVRTD